MLKENISKESYDELAKYDLVDDLEKYVLSETSLINIDLDDIKDLVQGRLYGYYKGNPDDFKLHVISDVTAKKGLIFIVGDENITLEETTKIIDKARGDLDISLVYGTSIKSTEKPYLLIIIYG